MFGGKKAKELEEELLALQEKQNRLQEQISNIAKAKDSAEETLVQMTISKTELDETKDQFSEGAYKKRGQWIGKLADYYEYYLYTKKEQLYVMAQIDYMPAIQQYTDYPVENDTIICLSVTQN